MKKIHDMTTGSLKKNILMFSIPLIFSHLLQVLFNMADIAVVGRFGGADALGSVGSTTTAVVLFTGFLIGIGSGVNALTALHLGARSDNDVEKCVHTSLIVSLIFGFIIMLIGMAISRPLLILLNTKEELLDGAVLYFRIYFLSMPAVSLYNFGNGVFSAAGDTKKPLVFLSAAGVINVALNLFFVICLGMTVDGVAWASVISQYISGTLVVLALFRSKECFALSVSKLHPDKETAKRVLSLGVPSGCQNAIFQLANLFIQAGVNSFDATMVSGNSAAANADAIIYNIMNAFYVACTSFMGQNYGAKKRDRVIKSYYTSLAYSFLAGLIPGAFLFAFGKNFLLLFTTDALVVAAGLRRIKVMAFSYCVSSFMDCTIAASRGIGCTLVPTVIVILGSCVFRIIWVYTVFAHFHTIESLYLLYVFSWSITAIAEILYFARIWKKDKQPSLF